MGEMLDGTGMGRRGPGGMPGGGYGGMPGGGMGYGGGGMPGYGGGYGANGGGFGGGIPGGDQGPSNVLRLRGLPFSAGKGDIAQWFADVGISALPSEEM